MSSVPTVRSAPRQTANGEGEQYKQYCKVGTHQHCTQHECASRTQDDCPGAQGVVKRVVPLQQGRAGLCGNGWGFSSLGLVPAALPPSRVKFGSLDWKRIPRKGGRPSRRPHRVERVRRVP
ncbi:hypothetical protein H310_05168 [Aphanomyces invadans]|uniref:Uncharacterized protein n=1 Tax=Aphanomyces invadans TaxID=157072 RepID=A0A024UDU1_9STRA|nr:hypothetical protein H310_05168 [Aphanomyces invadans]ETW03803.1 hypothetical protein H310_05168 [Aphanomyces invadans]|eukprot:XP_008868032.1 hypothetical protein H310_05168 [Aphanomyces invadans]